jgi:Sel1 repeat
VKRNFSTFLLLAFLLIPNIVFAGQLEDAQAAYQRKDYETAKKIYLELAQNGDTTAQIRLSAMYYSGTGVEKDYTEAEKWLKPAAKAGNLYAQHDLAKVYHRRSRSKRDLEKAYYWYSICDKHWDRRPGCETPLRGCRDGLDAMKQQLTPEKVAEINKHVKAWKPVSAPDATPVLNP